MTNDPENFLTRWSRRKREAAVETAEPDQQNAPQTPDRKADTTAPQPAPISLEASEPAFDLAKLPSIDEITADTDISGFLAPGVPAELKAAALRRAWVTDPKIRDFVGLNDYDFDFNTPGAIPGFGPLEMTDALRREVLRIVGNLLPEEASKTQTASAPPSVKASAFPQAVEANEEINAGPGQKAEAATPAARLLPEMADNAPEEYQSKLAPVPNPKDSAAPQQNSSDVETLQTPARRSHGGALPK